MGRQKDGYSYKIFTNDINADAYEGDRFEEIKNVVEEDLQDCHEMLWHHANSPQWRKFDHDYPSFAQESRNLCLSLPIGRINNIVLKVALMAHGHDVDDIQRIYNLPP
ncbi:hypothetical protein Lal_00039662 [Lupinus albus]|nr:hypothetical protein Lal_00039662 [Lupinus albus]